MKEVTDYEKEHEENITGSPDIYDAGDDEHEHICGQAQRKECSGRCWRNYIPEGIRDKEKGEVAEFQ